jgi:hypothetical protein
MHPNPLNAFYHIHKLSVLPDVVGVVGEVMDF